MSVLGALSALRWIDRSRRSRPLWLLLSGLPFIEPAPLGAIDRAEDAAELAATYIAQDRLLEAASLLDATLARVPDDGGGDPGLLANLLTQRGTVHESR